MKDINLWIKNRPIAHRGLHDNNISIPENSLVSFEKAIEKNYPIEIDVQITSDNKIVVFHDKDLLRACGEKSKVSQLTTAELQKFSIFGTVHKIPTFKEALETINGDVPLLIELKNFSLNRTLEKKVIKALVNYKGDFALQSFNPFAVRWIKKHSNYAVGQLAKEFKKPFIIKCFLNHLLLNKNMHIDFVAIDKDALPNKKVEFYKSKGLPILSWTITSEQEQNNAEKHCDNIIFENFKP